MTTTPSESLFEKAFAWPTLLQAWHKIEANDGSPGSDGVSLEQYASELEENLAALRAAVQDGTYRPLPLLRIYMQKPDGGRRPLAIPSVRDRIAQEAVALVLTPVLEPHFEDCSFGYRKGRSVQAAVQRIQAYRAEGLTWVVDADIQSFFDEVDHAILSSRLGAVLRDARLAALIELWITGEIREGAVTTKLGKGLPQGLPISPVLANLYLDWFDEQIMKHGCKLVRFADDFVILCRDKLRAEKALQIAEGLLGQLRLALKREKTQVVNFETGFRYLGTLFVRSLALPSPRGRAQEPAEPLVAAGPLHPGNGGSQEQRSALERSGLGVRRRAPASSGASSGRSVKNDVRPAPARRGAEVPFLRTLYIQEQGSVLARDGERLIVRKGDEVLLEVPAEKVDQIFVFGRCSLTAPVMAYCLVEQIPVILLSSHGQYYGILDSPMRDQVSLHRQQFARAADPRSALAVARTIVAAKLQNCRVLLQRHQRSKGHAELAVAIDELERVRRRATQAETIEQLMGYEGAGAARYFDAFGRLLPSELSFHKRVRRPPTDPVNSVLSFAYTLLFYNLYALIRARGLHPFVGHLHSLRDRHPSLVSDMLEELRAPIVDALVLYLFNSRLLTEKDFDRSKDPAAPCLLSGDARKVVLKHFETKLATRITHPHTGYSVDYRRCMDLQVSQMVQYIKGEIAEYQPMVIR